MQGQGSGAILPAAERARPLCDGAPFPKATNQEEAGPFFFLSTRGVPGAAKTALFKTMSRAYERGFTIFTLFPEYSIIPYMSIPIALRASISRV